MVPAERNCLWQLWTFNVCKTFFKIDLRDWTVTYRNFITQSKSAHKASLLWGIFWIFHFLCIFMPASITNTSSFRYTWHSGIQKVFQLWVLEIYKVNTSWVFSSTHLTWTTNIFLTGGFKSSTNHPLFCLLPLQSLVITCLSIYPSISTQGGVDSSCLDGMGRFLTCHSVWEFVSVGVGGGERFLVLGDTVDRPMPVLWARLVQTSAMIAIMRAREKVEERFKQTFHKCKICNSKKVIN